MAGCRRWLQAERSGCGACITTQNLRGHERMQRIAECKNCCGMLCCLRRNCGPGKTLGDLALEGSSVYLRSFSSCHLCIDKMQCHTNASTSGRCPLAAGPRQGRTLPSAFPALPWRARYVTRKHVQLLRAILTGEMQHAVTSHLKVIVTSHLWQAHHCRRR